jgi:hypothetical protein
MEVYNTNDQNLIRLNGVQPQQHIKAEFYTLYQHDNLKQDEEEISHQLRDLTVITDFFRWRNSLPEELKNNIPKYTQQLSLGKFVLGRIDTQRLPQFFPEFSYEKFTNNKIYRYEWFTHWDENFVSYIDKTIKIKSR